MKIRIVTTLRMIVAAFAITLCIFGTNASAKTHTVQFGGTLGFTYSPSSFNALVGDTVLWEGDFSMHPLASTTIPSGASSWTSATGTSFIYVIKVPGTYNYHCEIHFTLGMEGSFVATASGVDNGLSNRNTMSQGITIVSLVKSEKQFVRLNVPQPEQLSLQVFDMQGKSTATLVNQRVDEGVLELPLDQAIHAGGFFVLRATTNGIASFKVFQSVR